ncbi:MAG: hypothetical protein EA400_03920 [Chromatiaceae bacterium]|nr:MAG: hypothetical protein EA400_03920 [Chromatiaceae bacterium]
MGKQVEAYAIWHSSNLAHEDYVPYLPQEVLACLTEADIHWMSQEHESQDFQRIKTRYIEICQKLQVTNDRAQRHQLVDELYSLLDTFG